MTALEIIEKSKETIPKVMDIVDDWADADPELLRLVSNAAVQILDVATLAADAEPDSSQIGDYIQEGSEAAEATKALVDYIREHQE